MQSLAELLTRRCGLTPGEVGTVGVTIARELAALHARGRVHGAVSSETILLDDDGRPSLTSSAGAGAQPADDVGALMQLLRDAAGANAGLALLRVLGHPVDAATLAHELYAVCPPAPLQLPSLRGTSPVRTRIVIGAAAFVAVCCAGAVGVASAHAHRSRVPAPVGPSVLPTTRSPSPPSASNDWATVLRRLDHIRDSAFGSGDPGALRLVYAPGSAPLASDLSALQQLTSRRYRSRGLHHELISVRATSARASSVVLTVVDRLPGFVVVDAVGEIVSRHAARGPKAWRIVLVHVGPRWRISTVDVSPRS
jgi:hypothetical protein